MPPGSSWQTAGSKGYRYKEKSGSVAGISQILLKGSVNEGGSRIIVKGRDGNLDLTATTLPFAVADVIVQLSNTLTTKCWETTLPAGSVKKNVDPRFKAKTPP